MSDAETFADEIFGFHAQQAAEKLLKAWPALLGATYPITHNFARLLALLETFGADVARVRPLAEYTPYTVQFRYAPVDPAATPLDRQAAVAGIEALLSELRRRSRR